MTTLTKKQRILDFIAFVINKNEYFFHPINFYFAQKVSIKVFPNQIFVEVINDYFTFLNKYINYEINDINEIYETDDLKNFENFLKDNKAFKFINNNISHFYDDNLKFKISKSEFESFLKEYFELLLINKRVYISYFTKKIFLFENFHNEILNKEITKIKSYRNYLNNDISDFESFLKNHYKRKLNQSLLKRNLQVLGFIDNEGFYINKPDSLKKYLVELNEGLEYKYSSDDTISKKNMYLIINQNFDNIFHLEQFASKDIDVSKVPYFEEYINYLQKKNFKENEIYSIINVLLNNKYKDARFTSFNFKVDLFRFLYFIYYFDFQKEIKNNKLIDEKDFDKILTNIELFKEIKDLNIEMKRNFKNIDSTNGNYAPFYSKEKTNNLIKQIKDDLNIDESLLKKLPKLNKYNKIF